MPHQCTTCGHAFEDGSKEMLGGCPSCGGTKFQFYPSGTEVPDEPPENPEAPEPRESSVTNAVGRASTTVREFVSRDDPGPDPDAAWPSERRGDPSPSSGDDDIIDADAHVVTDDDSEDGAQASARGDLVTEDELALHEEAGDSPESAGTDVGADSAADDDLDLPESDLLESELPESDLPESDLPKSDLPESEVPESKPPESAGEETEGGESDADQPDLSELRAQLNDQFESIKIVSPGTYELNLMELYDRNEYIISLQEDGRYVIEVPEAWRDDEE